MQLLVRISGVVTFHIDGYMMQPMWFLVIFATCQLEYWCFDFLLDKQCSLIRCVVALMIGMFGIFLVHYLGKGEWYFFLAFTMLPLMECGGGISCITGTAYFKSEATAIYVIEETFNSSRCMLHSHDYADYVY